MNVFADRVLERSAVTGTGNPTMTGAETGYRTFAQAIAAGAIAIGNTFPYTIEAVDANMAPTGDWENGTGTLLTSTTFARTSVGASSNSGALVNFSAGSKLIAIVQNAADIGGAITKASICAALGLTDFIITDTTLTLKKTGVDMVDRIIILPLE